MSIDKLKLISNILQQNQKNIVFEINKLVAIDNIEYLKQICLNNNIETEQLGNKLNIKLKSFITPNLVYYDQLINTFESHYASEEFTILKSNGEYCFHQQSSKELIFSQNSSNKFKLECINLYYYFILYNFLKNEKSFADHHNDANNEIVIYSSVKGILKIRYGRIPEIHFEENISSQVEEIINTCSQKQLCPFFKNTLFSYSDGISISIIDIISKSNEILSITNRDYELVSKQFDFDKFRDSLYKEKEKYFTNIREIINKIFGQAIGIPISIGATVFATYKVSDDIFILIIVLIAFLIYIVFYIRMQFVYKADINELKFDFANDFEVIKSKSGLSPDIIQNEKTKIEKKINNSLTVINWLVSFIVLLGLLVIIYIFYEIIKSETICFLKSVLEILI